MNLETRIPVIVPHVRDDYPHPESDKIHNFHYLVESLRAQNFPFTDFELILPDTQWERRKDYFTEHPQTFAVKHCPKKASLWYQRKFPDIANGYNTGIIQADGELLLLLSSGCEFGPDALWLCWDWHVKGYAAAFMYDWVQGARVTRPDTRRDSLIQHDGVQYFMPEPGKFYAGFYGHQCCPLAMALKVNGFDELYDGTKGGQDVEFGVRLSRAGQVFVHDENLELREHAHKDLPWGTVLDPDSENARWDVFRRLLGLCRYDRPFPPDTWQANRRPIAQSVMDLVKKTTLELGGEIPPWHTVYTDPDLCFSLKNLWAERRERDGLLRDP